MSESALLDRIDEITADVCHQCDRPLGDSVSPWFCGPRCQRTWTAHQADVQEVVGYREAMSRSVGWCEDAAHWTPLVWVGDWSVTRKYADRILKRAERQWRTRPEAEERSLGVVSAAYVRPERTDDPADDYLVAQCAAAWARRLGLFGEWLYASALAEEVRPDVPSPLAVMAEAVRPTFEAMARSMKRLTNAFLPQVPRSHAPQQREGDRITVSYPGRTFTGTVAAINGDTISIRPDPPSNDRDEVAQAALAARRNRNTGPTVHADPRRNRRGRC